MDDAAAVGGGQGAADLLQDLQRLGERQRLFVLEALLQVLALQQIHDEKRRPVFIAVEVGDRRDVRVAQRRDEARLILKPLVELGAGRELAVQHLDRIKAIAAHVPGHIDGADGSDAKEALDAVGLGKDLADDVLVPVCHEGSPPGAPWERPE